MKSLSGLSFVLTFLDCFVFVSRPLVQAANSTYTSDAECQKLNQAYDHEIFLPTDVLYQNLSSENWSRTAVKTPACIFKPKNTNDLATVVKHFQQRKIKFAIRSGGHLPSPGAANIDDGVLIDLGGFDKVDYDAKQNTATVGSGSRWQAVYEQLELFNVTVVGGRVLEVGVGGLTLGGGLSYLSDLYGLVCDNVVNYEVVLGDGKVVNANRTSNINLFWALKGGGNNFGIVTRFTLSTYPNPQVWGGVKSYTLEDLPALFSAMYEYQTAPQKDPKANLMMQGYFTNTSVAIILNMIYLAPQKAPAAFEPFYQINATSDTTKIASLTNFLTSQGPVNFPPRVDWRATSFTPDKSLYKNLTKLVTDSAALKNIRGVASGTVSFGLQPISTSAIQAGIARGGNALGLRIANQTWFVIDSGWATATDDQTVHTATKEIVDSIKNEAEAKGKSLPYIFMNDASYDEDVTAGYGPQNVAKLRNISAQYDPHRVFQKLVPGGFKLPNV